MLQQNIDIASKVVRLSLQVISPPVEVDSEKPGSLESEVDGSNIVDSSTTYSPAESSDCIPHCPEDVSATSPQYSKPVHVKRPPMPFTYYRSGNQLILTKFHQLILIKCYLYASSVRIYHIWFSPHPQQYRFLLTSCKKSRHMILE